MRNRLLILVTIVCGALAAGLFWRSSQPTGRPPATESYAKARGYRSVTQLEEFHKKAPMLIKHAGGWTTDDFAYFRQAIASDNDKPAQFAVLALGRLLKIDQCREGLTIVGRRPAKSAALNAVWSDALKRWNDSPPMRPLVAEVIKGDNPDLAQIGKEIVSGSTHSQ